MDHPDLKGRIFKEYSVDITIAGYPKLSTLSKTFTSNHGTMVAGLICAKSNNNIGIAGIGSGDDNFMTRITAIKVTDNATGLMNTSTIINGIYYAVQNAANVINLSLGYYGEPLQSFQAAIDYAYVNNVAVVASAGNDNTSALHYPSDFNHVISVGGTTKNDKKMNSSNYGSGVDIAAPGESIYSTKTGSGYMYATGTSLAAPLVSEH